MKTKSLSIVLLLFLMLGACQKEQVSNSRGDLPDKIKKLTELNQRIFSMRSQGLGLIYRSSAKKKGKSTAKSAFLSDGDSTVTDSSWVYTDSTWVDSSWVYTDSTWVDSSDVWVDSSDVWVDSSDVWVDSSFIEESCAEITSYVDDQGYMVTVQDYGEEGCEEWGVLIRGRITIKIKEKQENFEYIEIYENYRYGDMSMDGYWSSQATGSWQWEEGSDSVSGHFGMTYTTEEEMTIVFDDGETVTTRGTFTEEFNGDQYIITEADFSYESSTDGTFTYKVLTPVVTDLKCQESIIPVSGVEEWTDKEGTYLIDYGDGTCDNLATVTENGETYTVDFEKLWEEDGEPVDSSLVNP